MLVSPSVSLLQSTVIPLQRKESLETADSNTSLKDLVKEVPRKRNNYRIAFQFRND